MLKDRDIQVAAFKFLWPLRLHALRRSAQDDTSAGRRPASFVFRLIKPGAS